MILITDSLAATGLGEGLFYLGDAKAFLPDEIDSPVLGRNHLQKRNKFSIIDVVKKD
ncbi:MAG: hypothetical protein PHX62_06105 [Bacilli bacterium]|nr:hypothetical protein [Bacilli bacterium]